MTYSNTGNLWGVCWQESTYVVADGHVCDNVSRADIWQS